jgi:GntR family transcriptional repressor for pyruvate dehydrogenase complex
MDAVGRKDFRPFTPAAPQRAFDIILRQMRDRIRNGELRPGDRLPSERELVDHFKVSRNTVREAVRMLEVSGLVEVKRGAAGGVFVSEGSTSHLSRSMSDMLSLASFSLNDLLEVRLWIGSTIAKIACDRGTETDFELLQGNIELTQEATKAGDWEKRSEANHEFQNLLAAACHNPIMLVVQRSITEVIREVVSTVGPMRDERLLASKIKLLGHLRERDAEAAVHQMEMHLNMVNDFWREALDKWAGSEGLPQGT